MYLSYNHSIPINLKINILNINLKQYENKIIDTLKI